VSSPLAHDALVEVGNALRHGRAADAALGTIRGEDVARFLSSVDVDAQSRKLSRAVDEAFEAALATSPDERALYESSALEGLAARDALESAMAAIASWEAARGPLPGATRQRYEQVRRGLAQIDASMRASAVSLVALNDARRRERDALAGEHRARAWWWSARAGCDGMVAVLRGEAPADAGHTASCEECKRDRERVRVVEAPPAKHLTADDLWRWDFGPITKEERQRMTRHASRCEACKHALDALAEGDRAIEEITDGPDAPEPHGDVVGEHAAFQVLARRDAKRVALVVVPRAGAKVAGVRLLGSKSKAKKTAHGYELDIAATRGKPSKQERPTLVVALDGGREIELAIDLGKRKS
jgi:hypothetical protein